MTNGASVAALDRVSVQINRGEFAIIMGRSGAGKSTLLGVMGGLLKPSKGNVTLDGQSLWQLDERVRAQVRAEEIGFVFQNAPVIRSLTALENVLLPQTFFGCPDSTDSRKRAMSLLDMVGLSARANAYSGELSGGEKRRVAIASALMNHPSILLADEPTGDLDAETESQIMDEFRSLRREGRTIVMVTHDSKLMSYASRIFQMDRGTICEATPHGRVAFVEDSEFTIHDSLRPQARQGLKP
jgi:ABC-type lipoprotein export system ATPase subunit